MRVLKYWYQKHCKPNDPLVIIITDFESSSPAVLHDFISILRYYNLLSNALLCYSRINFLYLSVHIQV